MTSSLLGSGTMTARRACVGALCSAAVFTGYYHSSPDSTKNTKSNILFSLFSGVESMCSPSCASGDVGAQNSPQEFFSSREQALQRINPQSGPQAALSAQVDTDTSPARSCVVVGGGIVGLTTAYFLAKDGVNVTVIEGEAGPVEGTSKGNAGALRRFAFDPVVGRASVPAMLRALVGTPGFGHVLFNPRVLLEWDFIRWSVNFLVGACLNDPCDIRNVTEKLVNLSQCKLDAILKDENIAAHQIDLCEGGCLRLFSDPKQFRNAIAALHLGQQQPSSENEPVQNEPVQKEPVSNQNGIVVLRGMSQIVQVEPRLQGMPAIVGALYQPGDRTANSSKFGAILAEKLATDYDVRFMYNERVVSCTRSTVTCTKTDEAIGRVVELTTDKGTVIPVTDTLVVCCGHNSTSIAKQFGDMLPVFPMRGYSVTFDGANNNSENGKNEQEKSTKSHDNCDDSIPNCNRRISPNLPPLAHLVIHPTHIYVTPFGNDVRCTAFAEFAPRNSKPNEYAVHILPIWGKTYFPHAIPSAAAAAGCPKVWMGNRPQTPDDLPVISKSMNAPNVFYNTGHGSRGWLLAAGSGYVLSELVGRGRGGSMGGLGEQELDALSVKRFWL